VSLAGGAAVLRATRASPSLPRDVGFRPGAGGL